ncbi:MAG: hypothetical protein OEZ59_03855 [Deltaproteobacteria bacterium]|nr:hypothetical protein [Deltaproteobacteria bacterium]
MKPKNLILLLLIIVFAVAVYFALFREIKREVDEVSTSISGIVEAAPGLGSQNVNIVRTDRLVLLLVDPQTKQIMALKTESPFSTPQNFRIGKINARIGENLTGSYHLVAITDKDGEIFNVTPGEAYGRIENPVPMGSEGVNLEFTQAFKGGIYNDGTLSPAAQADPRPPAAGPRTQGPSAGPLMGGGGGDPAKMIQGTIVVADELKDRISPRDHLYIMLFDPDGTRPVSIKKIPHIYLPFNFSIGIPSEGQPSSSGKYLLRVLTDKDNSPFNSVEGEVVGRSSEPIALGTSNLVFTLDQPYVK